MIAELKAAALLQGVRGRKKADIDAIADVLLRVSDLVTDFGDRLAELDINPLVAMENGNGCIALDALIVKKV
jgi:acyl-CoA synthetase (NDP forming)